MKFISWTILAFIVIVLVVIGTFLPSIIQSEYPRIFSKPFVDVLIKPESFNNISKTEFLITNKGYGPATNLTFTIYSANKILYINNNFSNTQIFLPNMNKTLEIGIKNIVNANSIQLFIPELIGVAGSLVGIVTTIDLKNYDQHKKNYYAVAIYDQGIVEGKTKNELKSIEFVNPYLSIYYFLLYLVIAIFFIFYIWKCWTYWHIRKAIEITKIIHDKLQQNIDITDSFQSLFTKFKKDNEFIYAIRNNKDISPFYDKLEEREIRIIAPVNQNLVTKVNREALELSKYLILRYNLGKYD